MVANQAAKIGLVNAQVEKQFKYCCDEPVGQKVRNIVPMGFAKQLIADATSGRRDDGLELPIEIALSPLESAEGV